MAGYGLQWKIVTGIQYLIDKPEDWIIKLLGDPTPEAVDMAANWTNR